MHKNTSPLTDVNVTTLDIAATTNPLLRVWSRKGIGYDPSTAAQIFKVKVLPSGGASSKVQLSFLSFQADGSTAVDTVTLDYTTVPTIQSLLTYVNKPFADTVKNKNPYGFYLERVHAPLSLSLNSAAFSAMNSGNPVQIGGAAQPFDYLYQTITSPSLYFRVGHPNGKGTGRMKIHRIETQIVPVNTGDTITLTVANERAQPANLYPTTGTLFVKTLTHTVEEIPWYWDVNQPVYQGPLLLTLNATNGFSSGKIRIHWSNADV